MINNYVKIFIAIMCLSSAACGDNTSENSSPAETKDSALVKGTYAYDADFLKKHTSKTLELSSGGGKILLSADYQGRVMTSSASGDSGISFGWLNYDLISAPQKKAAFNPVGGEERFWLGPEGGQYSLYFKGGDSFNISKWQVPAVIDTIAYDVASSDNTQAVFSKDATLTNYSGTVFHIGIERTIKMLDKADLESKLNSAIPEGVGFVGYETTNRLQNKGDNDWTKEKGLVSVWLLGMFTPSEKTTVIIPFLPKPNIREYITDNYFGQIPPGRLEVKDSVLYFTCDGKHRSKIGLSPAIAKSVAASYDFEKNVLSVIFFPVDRNKPYVNSKWELQKNPYKGDVVNSYNDGPLADGTQMGPFYEIESSSPAISLKKGESADYRQTTCHLQGSYENLKAVAAKLLGVNLDELKK